MDFVFSPFVHCWWTCSNDAHITFEYVEELWKFIETPVSDIVTDPFLDRAISTLLAADDTRVELQLKHHAVFYTVLLHKLLLALLCIEVHTAELIDLESLTVLTNSLLCKEDRSRRLNID